MAKDLTYREKMGHKPYVDPGVNCSKDEPLTEQHHKDDCDINAIVQRYAQTGETPDSVKRSQPFYGDFTDVPDLLEAKVRLQRTDEAFNALGAEVRRRFDNKVEKLISFLAEEKNLDEAIKLGLVVPKPPKEEKKPLPKEGSAPSPT